MNLTAAQALSIPAYVDPADAEQLVRWSEEATPVLDRFVNAHSRRRLPKAEREAAHHAHVALALLATIVQADKAVRSVTQDRETLRFEVARLRQELAQARVEKEALKGIVQNLHDRAVAATEALGVVFGPADEEGSR